MSKTTIKFNVCQNEYYKAGQFCEVKEMADITSKEVKTKADQYWLQIFNSSYRVSSQQVDWTEWNGCVFIDLDTKNYYNEVKPFKQDVLYDLIFDYLRYHYYEFFYNIHFSWSGNSYHVIFYFNVEKTETNFKKCVQFSREMIKECFAEHKILDILNYKNVLDSCVSSPFQGLFFNPSKRCDFGFTENIWFGRWDRIDEYELQERYQTKINEVNADLSNNFKLKEYKDNDVVIEAHHHTRMSIYMTLVAIFHDKKTVDEHWKNICTKHIKCPKYSSDKMYKEADKNNWYNKFEIYSYIVNTKLLSSFGYNFEVTFIPQTLDFYEPDEVITIGKTQYLSDANINLKVDKINHIFAGCGFGKTYWAKQLAKESRVCFISPLRSIAKDSFEDSNFIIIDEPHKDIAKHIFNNISIHEGLKDSKWSICTTWESFAAYEMFKINFDYIIVDEIHTLSMYDYRLNSIVNLKKYLPLAIGIKIIMTGTPSIEIKEFDCYKFKIEKEQTKVKCELLAYNNNYMGWICNDIKEWTKETNNYAVIFKDTANYKDTEMLKQEGIDTFIFNSNYEDNVNEVLETKELNNKITLISVYGQAGINLYPNNNKKVRLYILNTNGLAAIQYANRIRNKETIDKVIIPIKKDSIRNEVLNIDLNIDLDEAERKVKIINATYKDFDIFSIASTQKFTFNYGFNIDCLEKFNGNTYALIPENYKLFKTIHAVTEYEKQIQVLYNRLVQNDFVVSFNYLDSDTKRIKETRLRNNVLGGQLANFDKSQININKMSNRIYIKPNKMLKEVATGNLIGVLEGLLNMLAISSIDYIEAFQNIVHKIIKDTGTIRKADIERIYEIIKISYKWDSYYDNAFIYSLNDKNWDDYKLATAITRTMYNDITKDDWKAIADEMLLKVKDIRKTLEYVKYVDEELIKNNTITNNTTNVYNLSIENDIITGTIYTYLVQSHTRGKQNAKKIIIDGIEYSSKSEAYKKLGRRYVDKVLKSL